MTALVISNIRVTDAAVFETYKILSAEAAACHGGRFLVRGGRTEAVEGTWRPERLTVIEFPSWQAATGFVHSIEYDRAREARQGAAFFDMVIVETLTEPRSEQAASGANLGLAPRTSRRSGRAMACTWTPPTCRDIDGREETIGTLAGEPRPPRSHSLADVEAGNGYQGREAQPRSCQMP